MKKFVLAAALCLVSPAAWAQCNGVFPANTLCGNLGPTAAPPAAFSATTSVIGPASSTISDFAVWANTFGNQLADPGFTTGTSGHEIPFLDGNNTWSGSAVFSGTASFSSLTSIPYIQPLGTSTPRTVNSRLNDTINLKDYGAKGDGSTDDTTAVRNWLAAIPAGKVGYCPGGTYNITGVISKAAVNTWGIIGDGPYQCIFSYSGANTTNDIITVGDGTTAVTNVILSGFRVTSTTSMTGGFGLHLKKIGRFQLTNLVMDGQDGSHKLWGGFWLDGADETRMRGYEAYGSGTTSVSGDGLRINGVVGGPQADFHLEQGKIGNFNVGIRVAGGFGGLYTNENSVIANGVNMSVDNVATNAANRELFIGNDAYDSGVTGAGISVTDSIASSGTLSFAGTWAASNKTHGLDVASNGFFVSWVGGRLESNTVDGIHIGNFNLSMTVAGAAIINNGGWGIEATFSGANGLLMTPNFMSGNTSGNLSPIAAAAGLNFFQIPRFIQSNFTGTTTTSLGVQSPSLGTIPYTWIAMQASDGTSVWIPAWK